uniref:Uncharacterized protein n=1 Tax=Aegilops tauschii subsp. strangulata TaxID=200361 RepID=A0A453FL86_AEGTS
MSILNCIARSKQLFCYVNLLQAKVCLLLYTLYSTMPFLKLQLVEYLKLLYNR